jgi:hypothetical protein
LIHLHTTEQAEQFRQQLIGKSDREIVAMFATTGGFDADALRLARLELIRRNVPLDEVDALQAAMREKRAEKAAASAPGSIYGGSYIERHWAGELSLAQSYWVNGFLMNLVFGLLIVALIGVASILPLLEVSLVMIVSWSLIFVVNVWQVVGTWRATARYLAEGAGQFWPYLTRVGLALIVLGSGTQLVRTAIPQVSGFFNILRGDPEWPKTRVTLLPSGKALEFSGGIRLGSAALLEHALDAAPEVKVIYLDTPGGRLAEATAMAALIRARHLNTYVENHCASAGVMVLIAGEKRTARMGAKIGLHSGSFPGTKAAAVNVRMIGYLRNVGADQAFIDHVVATSPHSMWYPSLEVLKKQGIINATSSGFDLGFGTAALGAVNEPHMANFLERIPICRIIAAKAPQPYAMMVAAMVAHIRGGDSLLDAYGETRRLIDTLADKYKPAASADALDLYLDLMIQTLKANKHDAPYPALMLARGDREATLWRGVKLQQELPHYPVKAEQAFFKELFLDEPDRGGFDRDAARVQARRLMDRYARNFPVLRVPGAMPKIRDDQIYACEMYEAYFTYIRRLPRPQRTDIARYLVTRGDGHPEDNQTAVNLSQPSAREY